MKSFIPIFSVIAGFLILSSLGDNRGKQNSRNAPASDATGAAISDSADTTDLGGLHFKVGEIIRTDSVITAASLQLRNGNHNPVTVVRHTLKNDRGEKLLENENPIVIRSAYTFAWGVGFPKPPTQERFEEFTVEWEVKYLGETYLKRSRMVDPDKTSAESE